MSRMTNYMENKLADFMRGQGLTLPAAWHWGLLSAASDSSVTELSGTGYGRVPLIRNLGNYAGTQAPGSIMASTGSSHTTSNNAELDWGTSGSAWGTATHVGMFDASSGGNCWAAIPLASAIVIGASQAVSIAAGVVAFSLGVSGGLTNWASNNLIDLIWRAQPYTWPTTLYAGLYTSAPSNAGGGTECSGGSYARAAIASSLTAWSGTQGPGTTAASAGTSGRISNNAAVAYPAPTADWGTVTHEGLFSSIDGYGLIFWAPLAASRTVTAGSSAQTHPADSLAITLA